MTFWFQDYWYIVRQYNKGYSPLIFCQKFSVYLRASHYWGVFSVSKFHIFVHNNISNALLVILLFTWKWKLESKPLNNESSLVKTKLPIKKLANCSPYCTAFQYNNNLETQRSPKTTFNLKYLEFFKKIYRAV